MGSDLVFGMRLTYDGKTANAGIDETRAKVNGMAAGTEQASARMTQQMAATAAGMNNTAISAKQLQMATRQLPMQFTDIFTSLAAGQSPMMVMLQQGGQIKDMFGGVGAAATAIGSYIAGMVNPITLTTAAVAAAGYAWYTWGNQAEEAATKALNASKSLRDSAENGISFTFEEKIRDLHIKVYEAKEKFRQREKEMGDRFSVDEAMNLKAAVTAYERKIADLEKQAEEQAARDAKKNKPKKEKVDPNDTAVASMQSELFRKQNEAAGETAAQIKVYELSMHGATKAQIDHAKAAADGIDALNRQTEASNKQAKATAEVNKIIGDVDPLARAGQEWQKLLDLQSASAVKMSDEQMGAAYQKSMDSLVNRTDKAAAGMSKTWDNFRENTQRVLGDQLYDGMMGKFNNLEDALKQMFARIAANAAAANLTESLFGSKGSGASSEGWIGSIIKAFANANGNAFGNGGVYAFANGGAFTNSVYNQPTPFLFANGGSFAPGVMGEAGPEAVMPLSRSSDGKLGIRSQGGGGQVIHFTDSSVYHIDSRADRAQVISDLNKLTDQKLVKFREDMRRGRV